MMKDSPEDRLCRHRGLPPRPHQPQHRRLCQRAEFDGEHGITVYNRSLQRPGKANQIRPMEEWIVAVGKHPGIIAGGDWVRVQAMLDVNKSKSYRRPRSNVAPLSHCSASNAT